MDWNVFLETGIRIGLRVIISIAILLVSFRMLDWIGRKIERSNDKKKKLDKTITHAFCYIGKLALKTVIVISLVGFLGIDVSGVTALIASLGISIGLAINGALSNIAGGALLLITRPYRVDDYIEVAGYAGTVVDIFLCNTKLRTLDNRMVYVPNSTASTGCVVNYSVHDCRRVDITFSIAYEDDFRQAEKILLDIMNSHEKILGDPAPFARMTGHGESSISITARAWTQKDNYWDVYFDLLESAKERFDAEGIHIPYNQMDVHVKNDG